jgi:hypothetical protein
MALLVEQFWNEGDSGSSPDATTNSFPFALCQRPFFWAAGSDDMRARERSITCERLA